MTNHSMLLLINLFSVLVSMLFHDEHDQKRNSRLFSLHTCPYSPRDVPIPMLDLELESVHRYTGRGVIFLLPVISNNEKRCHLLK